MNISKPHICFVSESEATFSLLTGEQCDRMGGAELQQALLAEALQGLGYSITFIVPDLGQPDRMVTGTGINLVKSRRGSVAVSTLESILGFRRLWTALCRANADIYYHRSSAALMGVIAAYCRLRKKPFVFSVASDLDISGAIGVFVNPRFLWLYRYGLKKSSAIVVQSEVQIGLLNENLHREGTLVRSIVREPANFSPDKTQKNVLWVGSFRRVKRPQMYVELARRLPEYRFLMVGGSAIGEDSVYNEIRASAEGLANLELIGPVEYEETWRYFGDASVFVNTSSSEGFPNTYLQSWASGTPVVATFDADGLIDRFGIGRHCREIDDLADSVSEFMEDDDLHKSAGKKAIEYVHQYHRPETAAAAYDALFVSLCNKQ